MLSHFMKSQETFQNAQCTRYDKSQFSSYDRRVKAEILYFMVPTLFVETPVSLYEHL